MQQLEISLVSSLTLGLLILPGLPIALWWRSQPTVWALLTDALLASIAIDSAIYWCTPLQNVPLDIWFWLIASLAMCGAIALVFGHKRVRLPLRQELPPLRLAVLIASGLIVMCYVTIALVRPNVEWDAVNYYLAAATGFAVSNHAGPMLPHALTIADNAPMSLPPVMPTLYSLAISFAAASHVTADQAVRWIPIALLLGTWAATRRLARLYVPPLYADCAGLLFLSLPALVLYMVANPLNIDLALAFVVCALFTEFLSARDLARDGLGVGIACSLALLVKVTGLPILAMSGFVVILFWLAGTAARALFLATVIFAAVFASKLNLLWAPENPSMWVAVMLTLLLILWVIPSARERTTIKWRFMCGLAIGLLPSLFSFIRTSQLVGSPLGFYAPSLTHVASPNWEWAWQAIRSLRVYDVIQQPGLIQNAALGLLLWWGFSPSINLLAYVGYTTAGARRSSARWMVALLALYTLAWLTIFHSSGFHNEFQFREFLAVGFIEPIFAAMALEALCGDSPVLAAWIVASTQLVTAPFTWMAQETFFRTPHALMDRWGFNQWLGMSSATLTAIVVFMILSGALLIGVLWLVRSKRLLVRAAYASVLIVALPLVTFAPLLSTGISPGFSRQYIAVRDSVIYGYLPALDGAIALPGQSVLTFVGYGITWYSLGRKRPIDLTDAVALGTLRPSIEHNDPSATLERLRKLGARVAILPAAQSDLNLGLERLAHNAKLYGLTFLDDPLLGRQVLSGAWSLLVFDNSTTIGGRSPGGLYVELENGRRIDVTASDIAKDANSVREFIVPARVDAARVVAHVEGEACQQGTSSIPYASTFALRAGTSVVIPVADIVRQLGGAPTALQVLRIRRIELRFFDRLGNGVGVTDWRSSNFSVLVRGAKVQLAQGSSPFVAFPELGLIGAIDVNLGSGLRNRVYPILGRIPWTMPAPGTVLATLRSSAICPSGSLIRVVIEGKLRSHSARGWKTQAWSVPRVAKAGSAETLPLPRAVLGGAQDADAAELAIDRVHAYGLGANCPISQKITGGNLLDVSRRGRPWRSASTSLTPLGIESLLIGQTQNRQRLRESKR